ncbi:hypothetical protein GF325_06240 [Candidatus Bathyarchaeota archaeon]|nr:hypothetical protein [Candidatus Bathyarchaeota archaeon]
MTRFHGMIGAIAPPRAKAFHGYHLPQPNCQHAVITDSGRALKPTRQRDWKPREGYQGVAVCCKNVFKIGGSPINN